MLVAFFFVSELILFMVIRPPTWVDATSSDSQKRPYLRLSVLYPIWSIIPIYAVPIQCNHSTWEESLFLQNNSNNVRDRYFIIIRRSRDDRRLPLYQFIVIKFKQVGSHYCKSVVMNGTYNTRYEEKKKRETRRWWRGRMKKKRRGGCERADRIGGFLDASSIFFIDLIIAGGLSPTMADFSFFFFIIFFFPFYINISFFLFSQTFSSILFYDSDRASHYRLLQLAGGIRGIQSGRGE